MIPIERFHHVSIVVRELERAKAFYGDILKLQEIGRPPFQSRGAWYAIGEQQLHLIEHKIGETLRDGDMDSSDGHFAVWVSSYKETVSYLESIGLPFDARPDSVAGFCQIYVMDPDRNVIEFDAAYGS